jgi:hypothetical protein
MATPLTTAAESSQRDNDYFTSTVVGLPQEVTLGKVFTKRKLSQQPSITIDAMTAAVWHSDPARLVVKQQVKQSYKTLGLPFEAGSFAHTRSKMAGVWAFLSGFSICAALFFVALTLSGALPSLQFWLQNLMQL